MKAADLRRLVFLVEGSPQYLAKRMRLVESRLTGKQKTVLTAAPTATAQRILAVAGGKATAQLWLLPDISLQRRMQLSPRKILERLVMLLPFHTLPFSPLYRGRVLHLRGQLTDEPGVRPFDPEVRIRAAKKALEDAEALGIRPDDPDARPTDGRPVAPDFSGCGATSFYQMARPSNEEIDQMATGEKERFCRNCSPTSSRRFSSDRSRPNRRR